MMVPPSCGPSNPLPENPGPVSRRHRAALFNSILPRIRAVLVNYENSLIITPANEAASMATLRDLGAAIVSLSIADGMMRQSSGTSGEA